MPARKLLGCVFGALMVGALPLESQAQTPADTTPPQVTITSPTPGATLSGGVKLTVAATDDVGVDRVVYYLEEGGFAAETRAPFETTWITSFEPDGPYTLTAVAFDAAGNRSAPSSVQVTVHQYGYAKYDATLKVPVCHELTSKCDTNVLVEGRANLGPEKNTPNTLYSTCADGTLGTYKGTESIEGIQVRREDGTLFAEGKKVRVAVDVWVYNSYTNLLDLYFAADATNPQWTHITTLQPSRYGAERLVTEYTLPAGSLQALRAIFRDGGSRKTCATGSYDEADDVVFLVGQEEDSESPTVALTAPASGNVLRGSPSLNAVADDNFGVKKVEFYVGSTLYGTDTHGSYSVWWDTLSIPDGSYTLTAKAYDVAGHVVTSESATVVVDNTVPTVAFTSPQNGATLKGTVPLQASASDNHQLVKVEFYDGSTLLFSDTTAPYGLDWNTLNAVDGSRTLTATAYDAAGNTTSVTRSVYVDNTAPTVAITAPAPGSSVFLTTTISASASDNRAVTKVEFYDGTSLIGTDTSSPYSMGWSTLSVAKGSHTLTARAYDAAGHVTTSAGVTVQVK